MSAAGKWNVTMSTPVGTMKFTWDLANENGAWRGRMVGQPPVGDSELRAIREQGDALAFETTAQSPLGPLELAFNGAVSGDTLAGTCSTKYGEFRFAAARA